MKVINKIMVVSLVVLLSLVYIIFGVVNNKKGEELKVKKKQFAMYVQNQAKTGYDVYTGSTKFPEGYKLNNELTFCTDLNGDRVEQTVEYNYHTRRVSVTSNKTIYCTLYFDKISGYGTILEDSAYLSTEKLGDLLGDNTLYRYQGTYEEVTNNYICFNTDNKGTCLSNTERYMYRILGITQDNRMKLIKNEAITQGGLYNTGTHEWHSDATTDTDWEHSTLYNDLNSSYYLTNSYYVDNTTGWNNKIMSVNWKYGNINWRNGTSYNFNTVYSYENAFINTPVNAKIGLMYIYDYCYANNWDGNQELVNGNKYNTNGWIHRTHSDNNLPREYEWLLSNYFWSNDDHYGAWGVYLYGYIDPWYSNTLVSVRPVFYLTNEITLTGTGSSTDPYIIGAPSVS